MTAITSAVHHVGITVSDLRRSVAWYRDVLGLTPGLRTGGSGEELARLIEVDEPELRAMFLHVGNVIIELIGYTQPPGQQDAPANNDLGAAHICFQVDDIEAASAHLRAYDVRFNAPPFRIPGGPLEGCTVLYFRDPDGIQLEFFEPARDQPA